MSIELSLAASEALPRRQNAALKLQRPAPAANDELVQPELTPLPQGVLAARRRDFSAGTLVVVVAAHVLTIAVLLYQSSSQPVEMPQAEPAAMMVSLVSNPAPEEVEIIPEPERIPEPKPVIRKPEPVQKVVEPEPVPQPVEQVPTAVAAPAAAAEPTAAPVSRPVVAQQEPLVVEEVKEVIEPPKFGAAYLHNPAPKYPSLSRRIGEEGRVLLRVLVAASGAAESVEIETGSGSSRLDQAAVDAVKKWRFIPAKRDKEPISAFVIVPIQFTLNG